MKTTTRGTAGAIFTSTPWHAMLRSAIQAGVSGALLLVAGCPAGNHGVAGADQLARTQAPLAWTVNGVQAMHHLSTASMESKEPAPGNQFVVLDVSVRNRDVDPQVLSEGKLVAMGDSDVRTFDTPETMFSDEYLSLQVLAPAQKLRGKIAYEVPEHLPGVLYWSPGNGSKRILLTVAAPVQTQHALSEADAGDVAAGLIHDTTRNGPDVATILGQPARRPAKSVLDHAVASSTSAAPMAPSRTTVAAHLGSNPVIARDPDPAVPEPGGQVATIALPQSRSRSLLALPAVSGVAAPQSRFQAESARHQACQELVSRNEAAQKEGNLGFFAQSCRDYALPVHWRPRPAARKSLLARASDALARVVAAPRVVHGSDCNESMSHADLLICHDQDLAAMDRQLAQVVASASAHVDDPAALQREQQSWRRSVRDACNTTGCLEQVYDRRIMQVDALVPGIDAPQATVKMSNND